jgi:hypothetical protein
LPYLARRGGAPEIDGLPVGVWLRLSDFIERRPYDIARLAAAL